MISVKVDGIAEANRAMQTLQQKIRRSVIRKSLREGANINLKEVRKEAPKRYGALARAMQVKMGRDRRSGTETAEVKLNRKSKKRRRGKKIFPSKYMHLVTGGTKAHEIRGRLSFGEGEIYSKVEHPGSKANDFMGRAFERSKMKSLKTFEVAYARNVEQAAIESRKQTIT